MKPMISDWKATGWIMNWIKLCQLVHRAYICEYFMGKCFIYKYIFDTQQGYGPEPLYTRLLAAADHQYYIIYTLKVKCGWFNWVAPFIIWYQSEFNSICTGWLISDVDCMKGFWLIDLKYFFYLDSKNLTQLW